jgi:single-strand DNA-binding protein
MNKVVIKGRLTKNPEVRYLPSGTPVITFSLAVNRRFKDKNGNWQEEAYFFDIESFGRLAERLGKQLSKGKEVLLEGSLRQDKWENQAGEKRSKVKIVAERVELISKPTQYKNDPIVPPPIIDDEDLI